MMITKEEALQALEDLDDFARMDIGVEPIGAYNTLKKYIEQGRGEPVAYLMGDEIHFEGEADMSDFIRQDGRPLYFSPQPAEPASLCDCERGHNGMGMTGRQCDCPAGNNPQPAEPVKVGDLEKTLRTISDNYREATTRVQRMDAFNQLFDYVCKRVQTAQPPQKADTT